jgi:hypothetical protein
MNGSDIAGGGKTPKKRASDADLTKQARRQLERTEAGDETGARRSATSGSPITPAWGPNRRLRTVRADEACRV